MNLSLIQKSTNLPFQAIYNGRSIEIVMEYMKNLIIPCKLSRIVPTLRKYGFEPTPNSMIDIGYLELQELAIATT